jgi:hypothetical protein
LYFPNQKYADLFYADDIAFGWLVDAAESRRQSAARRAPAGNRRRHGHSSGFGAAMSSYAALFPGTLETLISLTPDFRPLRAETALPFRFCSCVPTVRRIPTFTFGAPRRIPKARYTTPPPCELSAPVFDLHASGTGHDVVADDFIFLSGAARERALGDTQLVAYYTVLFLDAVLRGEINLAELEPRWRAYDVDFRRYNAF